MNFGYRATLAIPALLAVLAACAPLASPHDPLAAAQCPPPPGIVLTVNDLTRYYACMDTLPAAELAREYEATSLAFSKTGRRSDRIRLALLLSRPDAPFHNTSAALKLLNAWPEERAARPSDLQKFAKLLSKFLAEQERSEDAVNDLTKALAAEKARSVLLQNKLDALKQLEINQSEGDRP